MGLFVIMLNGVRLGTRLMSATAAKTWQGILRRLYPGADVKIRKVL